MKQTQISYDEWQCAVADIMNRRVEEVPEGWVTPEQMMAPGRLSRHGLKIDRANRILLDLFKSGSAERKKFVVDRNGVIRAVFHYRLKK